MIPHLWFPIGRPLLWRRGNVIYPLITMAAFSAKRKPASIIILCLPLQFPRFFSRGTGLHKDRLLSLFWKRWPRERVFVALKPGSFASITNLFPLWGRPKMAKCPFKNRSGYNSPCIRGISTVKYANSSYRKRWKLLCTYGKFCGEKHRFRETTYNFLGRVSRKRRPRKRRPTTT